ncbi:malectin domain-containing carbohydrate-binding protein [Hymenobacter wooponensis]|uniref:T9SS type A sorting domain-containing protein n=1 Tax=Hymenobacter wooponensis TaxID=1525360 RepID=A0A4Z0MSD2_9BACT|nr:malectin domain-containing carbohydrate-binding protein [Hymenobacter wooponensis]TGD82216.1 T9SS type A sorting domain-containing protein [Hymenobacter wooponensis]
MKNAFSWRTHPKGLYRPLLVLWLLLMPLLSQAQSAGWTLATPSNTPKWVGFSVMINNKMYVFSGFDNSAVHTTAKCEVYDPATNAWAYLADMPYPVTHAGITVDGTKVYVAGGFLGGLVGDPNSDLLQVYDVPTNSWSLGPKLPSRSGGNALVRVGRKLHSFGGLLDDRQTGANVHYVLDLSNLAAGWTTAAPMPDARCHFATAHVGGKIYAMGGQVGHDGPYNDVSYVQAYDPATDTWTRLHDMPYIRSHSEPATFVVDGKVMLVGGRSGRPNGFDNVLNNVTTYNPATDTWTEQAPLLDHLFGPAAEAIGNVLIVSNGGLNQATNPQTTTRKRDLPRTPNNIIGFAPGKLTLTAAAGAAVSKQALLWAFSGTPGYTIDVSTLPSWLSVSPAAGTIDLLGGTEVKVTASTAGLSAGTYSATVRAKATGYPDATLEVALTVLGGKPKLLYLYGSIPPSIHDMRLADTGNQGMSQFNQLLSETGFSAVEALDASVTLDVATLSTYKVLILGSNNRRFSAAEKAAVASWVNSGGGLLAWSDAAFGWENGGLNSTVGAASDNDLTDQFGMHFLRDNGLSVFTLNQWSQNHYINRFNKNGGITIEAEGVSPVRTSAPATILAGLPTGKAQLNSLDGPVTAADAALAIAKVGQGRVVGFFDRNAFWNAGEGTYLSRVDNRVFAQRILQWAAGADDGETLAPKVVNPIADVTVQKGSAPTQIPLAGVFTDNGGVSNLQFSVVGNSDPNVIRTSINGSTLTLTYEPTLLGASDIVVRATDAEGLWVEDTFRVIINPSNPSTATYRLNAGGGALSTALGSFAADQGYSAATSYVYTTTSPIAGTTDDALYQSERSSSTNLGSFTYALPLPNGTYQVVLHFADIYWSSPGQRVFDVSLEGQKVLDNYDIIRKVGPFTATTETFTTTVSDGVLHLLLSALASEGGVDRPKLSALEVYATAPNSNQAPVANAGPDQSLRLPATSTSLAGSGTDPDGSISAYRWSQVSGPNTASFSSLTAPSPTVSGLVAGSYVFSLVVTDNQQASSAADLVTVSVISDANTALYRLNSGGGQLTTSLGTFASDQYYGSSNTYTVTTPIAGTTDDALYQTERYGNNGLLTYALPVTNGTYRVVLHFAENWWTAVGQRVFDVSMEGAKVLDNFDIFRKVGLNTATTETFTATVADGTLNILLSSLSSDGGVDQPKVAAIEVLSAGTNQAPVANAGPDQSLRLPATSTSLTGSGSDPDGLVSAYRWSQVSGPNTASFSSLTAATPTVSGLAVGTYVFSLVVTDNQQTPSTADQVTVSVISGTGGTVVYRLNAGGGALSTALGSFAADQGYSAATSYVYTTTSPIAGTTDDALYQSERSSSTNLGSFTYALPLPNGTYQVVLHFADIYWSSPGQRVFDVSLEGQKVLDNYDIIRKVGPFTATTETFTTTVSDGVLHLLLSALASEGGVDRPKLSALEVYATAPNSNQALKVSSATAEQHLAAKVDKNEALQVELYPNPTQDGRLWLRVPPTVGPLSYQLYSALGQRLTQGSLTAGSASQTTLPLELGQYLTQPGVYMLHLLGPSLHRQLKVVKQ